MIIITMDKGLENYDIERLGKIYKAQLEEGVIVLPQGAELKDTRQQMIVQLPSITVEEIRPTWRDKLFGRKPLDKVYIDEVHGQDAYEDEEDKE